MLRSQEIRYGLNSLRAAATSVDSMSDVRKCARWIQDGERYRCTERLLADAFERVRRSRDARLLAAGWRMYGVMGLYGVAPAAREEIGIRMD